MMFDEYRERRFAAPPTLRKMVAAGWYGRKSGQGLLRLLGREAGDERAAVTDLREALERARAGGPDRHHQKSEEQGKLPVRDRVQRLVDEDWFVEDGLLAHWEGDGSAPTAWSRVRPRSTAAPPA